MTGAAPTVTGDLVRCEELQRALAEYEVTLVMSLPPAAFAQAHIPGSRPGISVEAAAADLSPDEEIVVHCADQDCRASRYAHEARRVRGFRRVCRYAGGIHDRTEAGLPVTAGEVSR
jgi:rhodanese-related sulfurtransferase